MKKLENRLREKLVKMLDHLEELKEEGSISNNYFFTIFDKPRINIEILIEMRGGLVHVFFHIGGSMFYYTPTDKNLFFHRIEKHFFEIFRLTEALYEKIEASTSGRNKR